MTAKRNSQKNDRTNTATATDNGSGIRRDIFLNHRQNNLAVDVAVNKAIHEDPGLDEIPDLDDNLLVLNLKENLYYRNTEGSDVHLSQNIDNIIRYLIGFERDLRNEVNRYAYYHSDPKIKTKVFGADDIYPLLEKCFIRASVGDRRIDLDVFEAIAQRYEELSPELTMQLELMHTLAEMAHEWLVKRGFVEKRFEWSINVLKVKIVLLGPSQAGKTSLLLKYFRPKYAETGITDSTVGISDFITKVVLPNGTECSVIVYDTAGQERFEAISKQYCRGAHGVMLVYDHRVEKYEVPNEFDSLEDFMFQKYILHNFTATELKTIPVTFFANKSDLWSLKQQPNANGDQQPQKQQLPSKSVNFSSSSRDFVGNHVDTAEGKQRFHRHSYGTADSASFSLALISASIWKRDFYQIPNIPTHWKKVVNPTGNDRCHWVDVLAKGRQAEGLRAEGRQRLLIDSSPKAPETRAEPTSIPGTPTTFKTANCRLGLSPDSEGSVEKITINVNNVDLTGEVFPDEVSSDVDENGSEIINHYFGSAKSGQQVREAFTNLLYASCMAAYSNRKSAEKKSASSSRPSNSSQRGVVEIGGMSTTRSSWGCSFKC